MPFQRNSVWKNDRRSYLVDSVIRDRYIPNILVWDNGDGYIWVIDGRQRWESIFFFADGEYKLSKGTADFNGEDIAGKKFEELSSDTQFEFLTYNFTVTEFRECTFEEVEEMFYRVNQSVPLTSTEKTRVKVSPAVRERVKSWDNICSLRRLPLPKQIAIGMWMNSLSGSLLLQHRIRTWISVEQV
ncbi:DUF262 domain-containing protein [Paenibacillus lentus]|uniref:DUF262 domain-containing protein n=1 Tax=Paenibacillus lentus TaxID=1338368 RepID=A0A3S8RY48_9BACL|nr:DUF262 domain-containing protein [Paenibacillus lentus]